jgi:hypothetical protein
MSLTTVARSIGLVIDFQGPVQVFGSLGSPVVDEAAELSGTSTRPRPWFCCLPLNLGVMFFLPPVFVGSFCHLWILRQKYRLC